MLRRLTLLMTLMVAAIGTASGQDNRPAPFSIKNQNPFIQIFGLPPTEQARLLPTNGEAVEIAFDLANNSVIQEQAGDEEITLDGESYRLSLTLRRTLSNGIEVGTELPLVAHSSGLLDNFIEGWHDLFGLTNNERIKTTSNTMNYDYHNSQGRVMGFTESNYGIGDLRLFAAKKIYNKNDSALSFHTSLKLPTGDAGQLHGSGATDLSLSVAHTRLRWLSPWQLSTFINGGVLLLGNSDYFNDIQHRAVLFGSSGIIWNNHSLIDLKAQLDGHSAFYNSPLNQLGANTIQLTVGGSVHLSAKSQIDIGVGENLFTDTTPDFLLNITFKQYY